MTIASTNFIIKTAGICNLNCSYCYMYNMGDTTYLKKPKVMSREIADHTLNRIYEYASRNHLKDVNLIIHGGEPLLAGVEWTRWFIEEAKSRAPSGLTVNMSIQTNGTLLNSEWYALFKLHTIGLGVSFDGPPQWHDRYRVDHAGRGSYDKVRRSIDQLRELGSSAPNWGVLVVANPEHSGVTIYEHLLELGVTTMDFLWPDYHHDLQPPWPSGSLARYYKELFDAWYENKNADVSIRWFEHAMQGILSGQSTIDALGPHPITHVVIETDGSLEPLDVIRTCGDGMTRLNLNVTNHDIEDLRATNLFQECINNQALLPETCQSCSALDICGGGYMPHRFGNAKGFQNPSVHCLDLFDTLQHISTRIQSDLQEAEIAFSLV
ncbi:radical SAM protein [Sporosarcina sp. GW1-11]|uniref:radical SAM protein n=1 Tax=Sporosarcina sp. GW1-11 TaxID=2899126 RepID=UPI00294E66E7|nr:radical SAM protein [Sporosarcina sp. GW1-11]MDV6379248.1 radical SAM protein [Sporosarcina sp. GW1-11]